MNKALQATQKHFESSCSKTPEYLAWHRLFKREFSKLLIDFLGCPKVEIGRPNHFDMSGFFQRPSGQLFYFSISDLRWSKETMLVRTANDWEDYTGGTNNFIPLSNEMDFTFALRKLITSSERFFVEHDEIAVNT